VPLRTGTCIAGRFEISGPLGAGSMGEVYQAHDLKLHRDVAVKVLSSALAASEEHLLRFEREARAASALNHPNICTIYDVGQAAEAGDRPYLVMEFLRGVTLADMLTAEPLPIGTVVLLGVQIAEALDAAHAAGIVHRDVKPANIFVTARGDAKLLDFGLAAMHEAPDGSAASERRDVLLTNPGTAVGTVLYMSPEQALGDPLDPRTDIFSLGLVLYQMVTGTHAFDGRSMTAILDGILHGTPAGLDPKAVSPIPSDLRRLIGGMLEKNKESRPATAGDVASYLRAVQSGSMAGREYAAVKGSSAAVSGLSAGSAVFRRSGSAPAPAGPTAALPAPAVSSRVDRRRVAAAVAAVVLLIALGTAAATRWRRTALPPIASREPVLLADFANTTGEAVFDGALRNALEIQLQQSPYMNVVPASQVRSSLRLMERSPEERITAAVARDLCQRVGVKAILLGSIAPLGAAYVIGLEAQECRTGDVIARQQTQAASKTDVLASVGAAAAQIREKLGESLGSIQRFNVPVHNATTSSLEALKAYSVGLETRTKTGDVQAIPLFEHALELDPNFALAAARLASIYTNLHDAGLARKYIEQAFRRSDSLSEPERFFIKANYHYIVTGRLDDAIGTYRLWITTYPQDWIPYNNLAATYERLGRMDEAVQEARNAVRLAPNAATPYQQLARTLLALGRADESQAVLRDATARALDTSYNRALLFDIAFLQDDGAGMEANLNAAMPRADSYLVVTEAARAALATGQVEAGHSLYAQAVSSAQAVHATDFAGSLIAEQALADVLMGYGARAREELQSALMAGSGSETMWMGSLAAAFAGDTAQAEELAGRYQRLTAPAPDVVNVFGPALHAAIAVARQEGRRAVDLLNTASPYERSIGPEVGYLRGLGYGLLGDHAHAAAQFRAVAQRRGSQPANPLRALARLQLARTLRAAGQTAEARQAYMDFLSAWPNADRREPLLAAAATELGALASDPALPRKP
jgi:tetratricopeptide (TPR) repeat protein